MPRLVAMARSGETFITLRERYGLWLHLPPGAGGSGPIDEADAERAVGDHGFARIDRDFDTWAKLDAFRLEEAAKFAPPVVIDPAGLDGEDVLRMLRVARRWTSEGEGNRSRHLLLKLLRVPAASADAALHDQVVAALEAVEETATVASIRRQPTDPRKVEARRRWSSVRPAA